MVGKERLGEPPARPLPELQPHKTRVPCSRSLPPPPTSRNTGISFPRAASMSWVLWPPSTVRASARSLEILGSREERKAGPEESRTPFASQPPPTKFTHKEFLKLLRTPGCSAGVGCWKQELFTLQTRPCSQGTVPADGNGLFGKWPGGWGWGDGCSESPSPLLSAC